MATSAQKGSGRGGRNRIQNGSFEERLSGWGSAGARVVSAEDGHLVHTGTQAIALHTSNSFIAQTAPAAKGSRLQFIGHVRGYEHLANSPFVVRLRWVDSTGSFLGTALEIFVPQKQLAKDSWTLLWDGTNTAPAGTAGVNVRIDVPHAEGDSAIVIDDLAVR